METQPSAPAGDHQGSAYRTSAVSAEDSGSAEDRTEQLTASFSDTARALFSAGSAADTLQAVVDLAVETIDGCDSASIFVLAGDDVTIPAYTDAVVAEVDIAQHRVREGPGLDAIAAGATVYAEDFAGDQRWLRFGPLAVRAGVRSASSIRLLDEGGRRAALKPVRTLPSRLRGHRSGQRRNPGYDGRPRPHRRRAARRRGARLAPGRSGRPGVDWPGRRDPDGTRGDHRRRSLRYLEPCIPVPRHEDRRCGPSPCRHRQEPANRRLATRRWAGLAWTFSCSSWRTRVTVTPRSRLIASVLVDSSAR